MSDESFYHQRVTSGEYDRLTTTLGKMQKKALIALEYNRDFERDPQKDNFRFKPVGEKPIRFSAWIFGEIAPRSVGTVHQASGNHYAGTPPDYTYITDKTKVKDAFMLRVPTDVPPDLAHLFNYQLTILNSIRLQDEQDEINKNEDNIDVKEWIRPSDPDKAPDLICVYMGPKYEVPKKITDKLAGNKRGRSTLNTPRVMVAPPSLAKPKPSDDTPSAKPEPELDANYDPHHLPDYGGSLFKHTHSRLMQRHILDGNKKLVAPWHEYDKLPTGTVVLMRIKLGIYIFQKEYRLQKLYQIYADRVQILMTSNETVDTRTVRILDDVEENAGDDESDSDNEFLKAFDSVVDGPASTPQATTSSMTNQHASTPKSATTSTGEQTETNLSASLSNSVTNSNNDETKKPNSELNQTTDDTSDLPTIRIKKRNKTTHESPSTSKKRANRRMDDNDDDDESKKDEDGDANPEKMIVD